MAHTYTPGLTVSRTKTIRKERLLPLRGETLVKLGDRVQAEDIVARTELPGGIQTVNVVNLLSITPEDIRSFMLRKEGDRVAKDETIAENKPLLGLTFLKSRVSSPTEGTIEKISEITGQVMVREPPIPVQVRAYVDGTVVEVREGQGVVVETTGTFIQGIFGVGGEQTGPLDIAAETRSDILDKSSIKEEHRGKILVGGSFITLDGLDKARKQGVKGIVVGGLSAENLREFMGYDLGVAITGTEDLGLALIITEGFGKIDMAKRTFDLLVERRGNRTSINGATQIRAGVIRPEIVIPYFKDVPDSKTDKNQKEGVKPGDQIRAIREPYFGRIGTVKSLPPALTQVESESNVRVLEVDFGNGDPVIIPRANVELIEE